MIVSAALVYVGFIGFMAFLFAYCLVWEWAIKKGREREERDGVL